jgi:hypothetical protein
MDQPIASESDPLIPLSSNPEVNKYLVKINGRIEELKTSGLSDREILKNRLGLVWGESDEGPNEQGKSIKIWRQTRARRVYTEIQDVNDLLFLAVILVISPTECITTNFKGVLNHLAGLEDFKLPQLNLGPNAKRFFESTSAEQGFNGSHYYSRFMESLFPKGLLNYSFHK